MAFNNEHNSYPKIDDVLNGEAINAYFIVFGLTRLGFEPTIYRTRGEHVNHYTTDVVRYNTKK
jgi:hypothetical protein